MALLDFDGDYGRTYNERIRHLIPAYDAIFELAAAAAAAEQPHARRALVVGAGTGTELPSLLKAMPMAQFTLVEPSEQMRGFCTDLIARVGATDRVLWGPNNLDDLDDPSGEGFNVVISHNVLHVLAPANQDQLLSQMAERVAAWRMPAVEQLLRNRATGCGAGDAHRTGPICTPRHGPEHH